MESILPYVKRKNGWRGKMEIGAIRHLTGKRLIRRRQVCLKRGAWLYNFSKACYPAAGLDRPPGGIEMKVTCEACGGQLKVVKSAVLLELGADAGLAVAAYLGFLLGPAGLISALPALWLREQLFKGAKQGVKGFFECKRCGKTVSNQSVLSQIFK